MAVIVVVTCADDIFNHLDTAWGIIANAYGGDWNHDEIWKQSAIKWRDRYHELLEQHLLDKERVEQEVFGPY